MEIIDPVFKVEIVTFLLLFLIFHIIFGLVYIIIGLRFEKKLNLYLKFIKKKLNEDDKNDL